MKNREGSFKEKFLNQEALAQEAKILAPIFMEFKSAYLEKKLKAAEFVALYLIFYQTVRTPKNSFQGLKQTKKTLTTDPSLSDILHILNLPIASSHAQNFIPNEIQSRSLIEIFNLNFKGLPQKMNLALINWLNNSWPLQLCFHIPIAEEILEMQKRATRCVSVFTRQKSLSSHILNKRDALSFVIHDLEHAVNFYQDKNLMVGQVGFYHFVSHLIKEPFTLAMTKTNTELNAHLDYVISDMNAYSVHLMKYLYGIFKRSSSNEVEFSLFFQEFLNKLKNLEIIDESIFDILKNINSPTLTINEIESLHAYFVSQGQQQMKSLELMN